MTEFSIQTEIEVLEMLVDESPCHVMEITNIVDGHPITIDQACAHLHSEGCIVPRGRGFLRDYRRRRTTTRNSARIITFHNCVTMFTLVGWISHHNFPARIRNEYGVSMDPLVHNRTPFPDEHVFSNNGR